MKITSIKATEIKDSKGRPTIQTEVILDDGSVGKGAVPSGASTGKFEAHELRDDDGLGVTKAISNIHDKIFPLVEDLYFDDITDLDSVLLTEDGTENKSNLGANAILSVSIAFTKALAKSKELQTYEYLKEVTGANTDVQPDLGILMMEGGKHGDWNADIQEYMIIPNAGVERSLTDSKKIFEELSKLLDAKGYDQKLGMEGGFTPSQVKSNTESIDLIIEASENAGFIPGKDFMIAMDFAASEFVKGDKVNLKSEDKEINIDEWKGMIIKMLKEYPIRLIEDPVGEDDWKQWISIKKNLDPSIQLVGDDLTVTNPQRIQKAIDEEAINAVIIKPNQIGSVSETLRAIEIAENNGLRSIISHRGGETEDTFISDLVAGTLSTQTKFGAQTQKERILKYERLYEIYCK